MVGMCAASAQLPAPPPQERPSARPTTPAPSQKTTAPQVVTVLHRLNGLELFRIMLRDEQGIEAIANFDEAFRLNADVHTNVIAGLALEDGETIAVWLPEAEFEFPVGFPAPRTTVPSTPAPPPRFSLNRSVFASPDLTVIDSTGKKMTARFVGVDGATGLSILKLSGKIPAPPPPLKDGSWIGVGEGVRLLGPEPVPPKKFGYAGVYVRMGESAGTISNVTQAPSGGVARFKARAFKLLSPANVGAVAVNDSGETLGIIDSVLDSEATILPAASIRRAAKRVLAHQASVPKPWLGVKGDPIASLQIEQIQRLGWELLGANSLAQGHKGILLTSITPNSPAAIAALKAGDVILKVNDEDIQSAEDFSWLLEQAWPSNNVEFTVMRPEAKAEQLVKVALSASPRRPFAVVSRQTPTSRVRWLGNQGIETIALRPMVASRFGSTAGLLVVFVEPGTPAFAAGLQPGDVIETIDGRSALNVTMLPSTNSAPTTKFAVVRQKQKLVITVEKPSTKK